LLCALFCLAEAFTLYTLAKFAERYRARTYGQLVRRALGKRSAALLSLSVFLLQWGACVAYLVIIGDAFGGVIEAAVGAAGGGGGRSGDGLGGAMGMVGGHGGGKRPPAPPPPPPPPHADNPYRTPALLAVALGVVFPLCLPADLAALEAVSAAAVAGFAFTSFVVVLRGWQRAMARPAAERFSHVRAWRPAAGGRGLLDAVPLIVFGFNSHANVVTIFHELEPFPKAPEASRRARAAARRAAAAVGGLGSRVGSYARSLAALGGGGGGGAGAASSPRESAAASAADLAAAAAAAAALAAAVPSTPPPQPQPPSQLLPGVRTKKLFGMVGVIASAMVVIALGYVLVAVAGLVGFPPEPPSNILNAFVDSGGATDPLVTAARLVIGLVVVAHYPLAHHPAREALGDLADALFGGGGGGGGGGNSSSRATARPLVQEDSAETDLEEEDADEEEAEEEQRRLRRQAAERNASAAWRVFSTALFLASTLATALLCDLGGVLHLLGGTVASCLIFGIPGLLLINASIIKSTYYERDGGGWGGAGGGGGSGDDEQAAAAGGEEGSRAPLLIVPKKAGLRERGLVYSPGVSWTSGVALVGVCLVVMGMTIVSAVF
jgi:amino acid permease